MATNQNTKVVWIERDLPDILTVIKLTLLVGGISAGLSYATTGAFALMDIVKYFAAVSLNILTPILSFLNAGQYIGQSGFFQYDLWVWNALVLSWLIIGLAVIFSVLGLARIINPRSYMEPGWGVVINIAIIPPIVAFAIGTFLGASATFIGKAWMLITFHVFMLPSVLLTDAFQFTMERWLAIIGGTVVVLAILGFAAYTFLATTLASIEQKIRSG